MSCLSDHDGEDSRPLRVAYIVHGFDVGGIERCVAHLVNHLDRGRFEPLVVSLTRSGAAAEWIERDDVPVWEIDKRAGNDPQAVLRLARLLREQRVDVVHSHNWGTLVETALARQWAGVPVHVHAERGTVMGDLQLHGPRRWLRSRAMRWALDRVDAVVSNAHATARRVEELCGYPADRITVIPNGVKRPQLRDADGARAAIRADLGIGEESLVVGSVGRLVDVKNFAMAIDAVSHLRTRELDAHLILVGDGPERSALRLHARELGIEDRVHLVGHRQDTGRWLAAMDVYINCSNSEGMSQSILEAMAMGLPLVVTDVGDSAQLVSRDLPCGHVVAPCRVDDLVESLALLNSREARRVLSERAAERHRLKFELGAMIAAYEELYELLLIGERRSENEQELLKKPQNAGDRRPKAGVSPKSVGGSFVR